MMSDDAFRFPVVKGPLGKPAPSRLKGHELPRCPGHLSGVAVKEWRRVARLLHDMGVLTAIDRAALAAYCQAYGRWVEAEEKLSETPILLKTPSGYIQQSPWLGIANKQLELMGRYMVELGMTPASRSRVSVQPVAGRTAGLTILTGVPRAEDGAADRLRRKIDALAERIALDTSESGV